MSLPNFIIFGAIKSGTGALYQYLSHHPEIYMSAIKEPRFFTDKNNYEKIDGNGSYKVNIEAYKKYFRGAKKELAIGEASSNYINSLYAAEVIKQVLPEVKLIATLRNPVDRAYAHYGMINKGKKNLDLPAIKNGEISEWAEMGLYYKKLKPYYRIFNKENIKIMILDEWDKDVEKSLKDIYIFLGVDEHYQLASNVRYTAGEVTWPGINRGGWLKKLKPYIPIQLLIRTNRIKRKISRKEKPIPIELRRTMMEWYREDIEKLQSLIKKDLSVWLKEGK